MSIDKWDREAAKARLAKITPGEWSLDYQYTRSPETTQLVLIGGNGLVICDTLNANGQEIHEDDGRYLELGQRLIDMEFMANAPDDLHHAFDLLERQEAEIESLGNQLEADRTKVAECLTTANRTVDSRHWLTEGRGSYEWNDDRWYSEFYAAAIEFKKAIEPLVKIAANWQGCPQTGEAIARARIDLEAENQRLREELARVKEKLNGLDSLVK